MYASSSRPERGCNRPQRKGERGIAIMLTALILLLAVPIMGLLFDGTLMFVIKARLQGAVDGAVLAGARALARGSDGPAQIANAEAEATTFIKLNYPNNFMFAGNVTIDATGVDTSVTHQRTVTATAHVGYSGLFMRTLLGNTSVSATASATRRDVNVVMVVDRSGSLAASGSCAPLQAAAVNFVGQFASGRDEVGLVTFASSTYVNFPISTTFDTASPNIAQMINGFSCAGSTSSAMGLWTGYQQLVALNQPGAFNVILFFTDGEPTGVAFDLPVAATSTCTGYTPGTTSAGNMTIPSSGAADAYTLPTSVVKGYIRGIYNTYTNVSQFFGPLARLGVTGGNGLQSIVNSDILPPDPPNYTASAGCAYYLGWSQNGTTNNLTTLSDFVGLPTTDIFGNSANTSYQSVTLNSRGLIDLGNSANAYHMALNAADSAATNIRNGARDPVSGSALSGITIFSIGLGNAAIPASPIFLERASNDPRSPIYDSTKPAGAYIYAATAADLQSAFSEVASEILRLAK